jgi:arginine N-succinyltransferase
MDDLPRLMALARQATYGLTTLPPEEAVLARRIDASERAFAHPVSEPRGETYLFVLEDEVGVVQGVSGIVDKVGGYLPFFTYRRTSIRQVSERQDIEWHHDVLSLEEIHDGPTEIGSLFLAHGFRRRGAGRFLSIVRFLFMAAHPRLFEQTVIAEMRGVVDSSGNSPFWEALGRHFFGMDFPEADYCSMVDRSLVGDLMPRHPIYLDLLPPAAQAVVGEVHANTRPALELLLQEGFAPNGCVDLFDAGPVVACQRDRIGVVRRAGHGPCEDQMQPDDVASDAHGLYVVMDDAHGATAICVPAVPGDQGLALSARARARLGVAVGDPLHWAALRA